MKCTFSAREPNILMEVEPGDLFVPLGPDLVECVCAVRSVETEARGFHVDVPRSVELDPNALRSVVVIACRVGKHEPEYYPTGFQTVMSGATPISFLEQVEPAAFRERMKSGSVSIFSHADPKNPIRCEFDILQPASMSDEHFLRTADAAFHAGVAYAKEGKGAIPSAECSEPHKTAKACAERIATVVDSANGVRREVPIHRWASGGYVPGPCTDSPSIEERQVSRL